MDLDAKLALRRDTLIALSSPDCPTCPVCFDPSLLDESGLVASHGHRPDDSETGTVPKCTGTGHSPGPPLAPSQPNPWADALARESAVRPTP